MKQINLVLSLHFFAFIMIFQTQAFAQAPQWQWVRGGGSASDSSTPQDEFQKEKARWIGLDNNSNIYLMTGLGSSSISIDTSFVPIGFGGADFAIASYACNGTFRWVRYYGGIYNDIPLGMTADDDGNVFFFGYVHHLGFSDLHYGDTVISATNQQNPPRYFLGKLDSLGNTQWLRFIDNNTTTGGFSPGGQLIFNNQGELCLFVAYGSGNIYWGTHLIPSKGRYVIKFDKHTGNVNGVTKLDFLAKSQTDFTIDEQNNYYARFSLNKNDTLFLANDTIVVDCPPGISDCYWSNIAAFSANGDYLWHNKVIYEMFTANVRVMFGQPVLLGDKLFLIGFSGNNSEFLGDSIINPYMTNFNLVPLVVSFNKNDGSFVKVKHVYNVGPCEFHSIGRTSDKIILSGKNGIHPLMYNIGDTLKPFVHATNNAYPFLLEIDPDLNHFNWGSCVRSNGALQIYTTNIMADKADRIFLGGSFESVLYNSFGDSIVKNGGARDFFVAKIAYNDDCSCVLSTPASQIVSINGNTITVKGTHNLLIDSLAWIWGDGSQSAYSAPNTNVSHTYALPGTYNVCLRTYNYCGENDSCLSVTITAVDDPEPANIRLYPNPAGSEITIENPYPGQIIVNIYDLRGKLTDSQVFYNNVNRMNISALEPGVYLFELQLSNGRSAVRKVVKTAGGD